MSVPRRVLLAALLLAPLLVSPPLSCAAQEPARIRGTVTKVVGTYVSIATPGHRTVTVAVPAETPISVVVPARIADIRPGSYIGTAAMPQPDGTLRALEVHVFPDDLRGVGQGHHPWDLRPGSTMTNGVVGTLTGNDGRRLTVAYQGGEQTVVVPPDVPVVAYRDGSLASLVKGAHVLVAASPSTDGMLRAIRIVVGADGSVPPM